MGLVGMFGWLMIGGLALSECLEVEVPVILRIFVSGIRISVVLQQNTVDFGWE